MLLSRVADVHMSLEYLARLLPLQGLHAENLVAGHQTYIKLVICHSRGIRVFELVNVS